MRNLQPVHGDGWSNAPPTLTSCSSMRSSPSIPMSGLLINRKKCLTPPILTRRRKLWRERLRFEYLQELLGKIGARKKNLAAATKSKPPQAETNALAKSPNRQDGHRGRPAGARVLHRPPSRAEARRAAGARHRRRRGEHKPAAPEGARSRRPAPRTTRRSRKPRPEQPPQSGRTRRHQPRCRRAAQED